MRAGDYVQCVDAQGEGFLTKGAIYQLAHVVRDGEAAYISGNSFRGAPPNYVVLFPFYFFLPGGKPKVRIYPYAYAGRRFKVCDPPPFAAYDWSYAFSGEIECGKG